MEHGCLGPGPMSGGCELILGMAKLGQLRSSSIHP